MEKVNKPDENAAVPIEQLLKDMGSNRESGLSTEEVKARLSKYGYNEIPEKRPNPAITFLRKFWGLTPWMLEVTMVLTYVFRLMLDLYILAALLLINGILGFSQEQRANAAVESLKQKLRVSCRVMRDGAWQVLPAREIVPGDISRIRAGDFVSADMRVIDGTVEVDQSALTGESLSVNRKDGDLLYSGSIVRKGEALALVTSTGVKTYFGKTAQLVQIARHKLHMEAVISGIVKWLLVIVGSFLALDIAVSLLEGLNVVNALLLALILLISAIPVALPAMFTISMAIGSVDLSKKGVLVTRLSASEDAASMDTLCVDKTGTLTMNKLSITQVMAGDKFSDQDVILYGALASEQANQDPIDMAFINAIDAAKLQGQKKIKFIPFDPSTRRTEVVIIKDEKELRILKGQPSVIISLCKLTQAEAESFKGKEAEFAKKGFRTIAIAAGVKDDLKLVGVAALSDSPRPGTAKLIAELKTLGISIKMLTGDAVDIAREIASTIKLGDRITNIADVKGAHDELEAAKIVENSDGFAGIYPEDKYLIIKDLQAAKHITGMTGDGVNDSPSLRQAEVGIAVSNATDVAKSAASVVLTEEGLVNIVDLVKTGRVIHQRIITWILNKIVKTFQIVVFTVVAFLLTGFYVVSPFDVILLLLLIDFVTISISTDNVRWSPLPDTWKVGGLTREAVVLGAFVVAESLGFLDIALNYLPMTIDQLHTLMFDLLIFSGMLTIFVVRERGPFWKSAPSRLLLLAVLADILISSAISIIGIPGLTPIPAIYVLIVAVFGLLFFLLLNDLLKTLISKRFKNFD